MEAARRHGFIVEDFLFFKEGATETEDVVVFGIFDPWQLFRGWQEKTLAGQTSLTFALRVLQERFNPESGLIGFYWLCGDHLVFAGDVGLG